MGPARVPQADTTAASELDWQKLFKAAPVALAFCDRSLRVMAASERFASLLRIEPRAAIGQAIADLLPGLQGKLVPLLAGVVESGRPIVHAEFEGQIAPDTDLGRWWSSDIHPVDGPGGERLGVTLSLQDISGARANEERVALLNKELRRQVGELETLLRVIPIGISIARDPKCQLVTNNPFQARLLGHAPDENASIDPDAPGRQTSYRVYRDGVEMSAEELPMHRALRERREVLDVEFDVVVRGGKRHTMIGHGAPLYDEAGQPRGAIAAFADITLRKEAEEALRASERRFRALADALPHVVWTATPAGAVDYVNVGWRDYTGLGTHDDLGCFWEQALDADDRARTRARWHEALSDASTFEMEVRLRRRDGAWRWHLLRALPLLHDDGGVRQWIGTMTDIDAHKRAEHAREHLLVREKVARAEAEQAQRRAKMLEAAMHVLASSLDYEAALANITQLALGELADLAVLEVLEGDHRVRRVYRSTPLVPGPKRARLERALAEAAPDALCAMTRGKPEFEPYVDEAWVEWAALSPEHADAVQDLGLDSIVSVFLEARGRVVGALTFCFTCGRRHTRAELEVGEQLGARAALAIDNTRLYQEAQAANVAKDRFLAAVSHELRTPLNAIVGWARLLRGGEIEGEGLERAIEVIDRNAQLQKRLVEDLLDVTRAAQDRFVIAPQRMDLAAVVGAAVDMLAPTAEERAVALVFEPPEEATCAMSGDPQRLQQVAWNLIANAIQFTPPGGRIRVRVAGGDDGPRLVVTDDGEGIAAEFVPHLFEPFQQAAPDARRHGGLGLGLSIARRIVEAHGGHVEARSDGPGRGAEFVVTLPVGR